MASVLSDLIWSVADLLRGDYRQSDYGKVIFPFTLLRRLDCVLESIKEVDLATLMKYEGESKFQLERCVILAADEVVTPVEGEYFSVEGLEAAGTTVQTIARKFKRKIQHTRLVVNKINASMRRHLASLEEYRKLPFVVYILPQESKLAESQFEHLPLGVYFPASRALPELIRLAADLLEV